MTDTIAVISLVLLVGLFRKKRIPAYARQKE